jgi:hypothetical protein
MAPATRGEAKVRVFCGLDVSRRRSEAAIVDDEGRLLGNRRIDDGVAGLAEFCSLLVPHIGAPDMNVDVAVRTGGGPLPAALTGAGHRVWTVDPDALHVYRMRDGERRGGSDAVLLANVLRVDGLACRHYTDSSELLSHDEALPLARAVQALVWSRHQEVDTLRFLLREFFPAALVAFPDLAAPAALRTLARAATPAEALLMVAEDLNRILLADNGATETEVERVAGVLQTPRPRRPAHVEEALGSAVIAAVSSLQSQNEALLDLERALEAVLDPQDVGARDAAGRRVSSGGRRRADGGRPAVRAGTTAATDSATTGTARQAAGPGSVPGPIGPVLAKRRPDDSSSVTPPAAYAEASEPVSGSGAGSDVVQGFKPGAARPIRDERLATGATLASGLPLRSAQPSTGRRTGAADETTERRPDTPDNRPALPRRVPGGRPTPASLLGSDPHAPAAQSAPAVQRGPTPSLGQRLDRAGSAAGQPTGSTTTGSMPAAQPSLNGLPDGADVPPSAPAAATGLSLPRPFSPRRPVPDPEALPIFAEVQSAWFHEPDLVQAVSNGVGGRSRPADWASPADEGWRAAEAASRTPAVHGRTQAGLPMRRPKANLVPGAALRKGQDGGAAPVRSRAMRPEVVRALLASYHQGFRRGREEADTAARRTSLGSTGYLGASR